MRYALSHRAAMTEFVHTMFCHCDRPSAKRRQALHFLCQVHPHGSRLWANDTRSARLRPTHLKRSAFTAYGVGKMPFSPERTTEIQSRIRAKLEGQDVNDWERSFLTNMEAKFAKDGTRTSLSKAQFAKLHKILGLEQGTSPAPSRPAPQPPRPQPKRTQNPIKTARRVVNAPRRAVKRAERQLVLPLLVVVGVVALIGSLSAPTGGNPTSTRSTPPVVSTPSASYVYVTGSSVNQRQGPSTSYAVMGSLRQGVRVEVLSRDGQWTQIRSNLGDGWMASRYLTAQRPASEPASQSEPRGTIRASAVRVVDGDTIEYGGLSIRLTGYDTPETYYAQCQAEKDRGDAATERLRQLIRGAGTLQLFLREERDRYGRGLGSLLSDGRNVGDVPISEGLARPYNGGQRRGWC